MSLEVFQGSQTDDNSLAPIRPKRNRKRLIYLAVVIFSLLILCLVGYILFFRQDKSETAPAAVEAPVVVEDNQILAIVYGYGESFGSKSNVFYRDLVEQSDRQSLAEVGNFGDLPLNSFGSNLLGFQVSKNYAYVLTKSEIWLGGDNEKPEKIYTHEDPSTSGDVTSAVVSRNGEKIAFAVTSKATGVSSLWVLDVKTKQSSKILEPIEVAPFAWSADNKTIFIGPNILRSSNQNPIPMAVNVKDGTTKALFESVKKLDFGAYAISIDGAKSAYVKPTISENKPDQSSPTGYHIGKPYKVLLRDSVTNQISEVKDINNEDPPMSLAFDQQSKNLYWSENNQIFRFNIQSGETTVAYAVEDEDEKIDLIYAATASQIIIGQLQSDNSHKVSLIDIKSQAKSIIMETTGTTTAVGLLVKE